ncbi:hypothetical protein ACWCQ1_51885 [Streptomyces sp. NPDC002144]
MGCLALPLLLTEWGGSASPGTPLEFIVTAIAFSFVMTWVFNRPGESLPLAMLLHSGVNNYFSLAWSDMFPWLPDGYAAHAFLLVSAAAAAVLLIATRGWLGCPPARDAHALPGRTA